MNKNTLIGLLLAVVVLGGGYLLIKSKPAPVVTQTPGTTNPDTTTDDSNSGTVPPAPQGPGAPLIVSSADTIAWGASAVVGGQVNPNGASSTYWFEYGTTTAFGAQTANQALGSGYGLIQTPAYITGLKPNTQYYFRLSAKNSFATVTGKTFSFSTNSNPPPQGTAATARTGSASSVARTTASVTGQVNAGNLMTTYWFEYGKTSDFGSIAGSATMNGGTTATTVAANLTGLDPLTKYYYRVNAQNQYGTVNGSVMSFTTTGPAAAKAPSANTTSASNIQTTTAQMNGRINPNGGETTYWFEYSENSLLGTLIGNGTSQQVLASGTDLANVHANATGLRTKTTYYYRIVARNSAGTVRGGIVSFKTK